MRNKLHPILNYLLFLTTSLLLVFFLHTYLLSSMGMPKYGNLIIKSYSINGLLAASIYVCIYLFKVKLKNYIGFLFIGGSFLKFSFFFLLFYSAYSSDGQMDKIEFAAFFVPYALSLTIETIFMARLLNELE